MKTQSSLIRKVSPYALTDPKAAQKLRSSTLNYEPVSMKIRRPLPTPGNDAEDEKVYFNFNEHQFHFNYKQSFIMK